MSLATCSNGCLSTCLVCLMNLAPCPSLVFQISFKPSKQNLYSFHFLLLMSPPCCVEKASQKLPSGQTSEGAHDDDDEDQNNVERIERIIVSKWFWAYTEMMGCFADTVLGLFSWCEGCPCHRQKDAKPKQCCPMKGRLAAHFAAGEMYTCLDGLLSLANSGVTTASSALSVEDRTSLVLDFAAGRACLYATLQLKWSFWQQLPHCLCGLAHEERSVSIASGARALMLFDALMEGDPGKDHPIVVKFCVNLRDDLQEYMAGRALKELPELLQAIAAFRFLPTAERNIEGQHAIVHRKIAGKPNAGPGFVAWQQAKHDLLERFRSGTIEPLAIACAQTSSLGNVCRVFGFMQHPVTQNALMRHIRMRDAVRKEGSALQQMLLRADPTTIFA
eukprot:6490600-Amphidinium_carterae.2